MKHVISILIAAVLMTSPIWAQDTSSDSEKSAFVPRSARGTSVSTLTFIGNKDGLRIIDHKNDTTTYYTARKTHELRRLSAVAQQRADEHRQKELDAQDNYEIEQKKMAEVKAAEDSAKAAVQEAAKAAVQEVEKLNESGNGEGEQ